MAGGNGGLRSLAGLWQMGIATGGRFGCTAGLKSTIRVKECVCLSRHGCACRELPAGAAGTSGRRRRQVRQRLSRKQCLQPQKLLMLCYPCIPTHSAAQPHRGIIIHVTDMHHVICQFFHGQGKVCRAAVDAAQAVLASAGAAIHRNFVLTNWIICSMHIHSSVQH